MRYGTAIFHLAGVSSLIAVVAAGCALSQEDDVTTTRLQAAQETSLTPMEMLGKALFFDKQLSSPPNQSCASCHAPGAGWTGPVSGINQKTAVYPGARHQRFGNRKPPSAAYATTSPVLKAKGCFFTGGNFWDGRATGLVLKNPAADQAMGPFLNPVEQNNPSEEAVCATVAESDYAALFEAVWGEGSLDCSESGVHVTFERVARAIAAFEASPEVNAYTSKFDLALDDFTDEERWGLELFEGKALCAACHNGPEFTDYTYDNLGVPRNPDNPFYDMDEVYVDGVAINPEGDDWVDLGLGGFLASLQGNKRWKRCAAKNMGKHKVPTLRNVDLRSGPGFVKAYMHNGVFKSLEEVVHFYNTRDVEAWPPPEVGGSTVNTAELGDLGLSPEEEHAIVVFLGTLSDGYQAK
jgi:cytochrome c peroxidase